jgi:feruloyl-CoA synthase
MTNIRRPELALAPAVVESVTLADGTTRLRSPLALGAYPPALGEHLRRWAKETPQRIFLAERNSAGAWDKLSYLEALKKVESIAQSLLDRQLGPQQPVVILSDNSVRNALLQLACMHIGVPAAPLSPTYSLISRDHAKLKYLVGLTAPKLLYVENGTQFAAALASLDLEGVEIVVGDNPPDGHPATLFSSLTEIAPTRSVAAAFAQVGPDTVAKILFTSGSTGTPKGVLNTQRMLCSNQQGIAQVWPFLETAPPVLLDWLPWHHTFGGNHNFNLILRNGGTLYIDSGKPVPGLIERTVSNLREISPSLFFNVPRGFDVLLPYLENDAELSASFFRNLKVIFYAAAALSDSLWQRLEKLSLATRGDTVFMASAWGSTETSPLVTSVHFPIARAGVIGLPIPGTMIKMVPNAGKLELRVHGPCITPGYYKQDELTRQAFDDEGFYKIGDAGKLADPEIPASGIIFDGRVSEDFKLATGTWVHVSNIRLGALAAATPLIQDAVVTGHDRNYIGLLIWPNLAECARLAPEVATDPEQLIRHPAIIQRITAALANLNQAQTGSSMRVERVLLMADPPQIDADEITDKGYINQRATLEKRAGLVTQLYAEHPGPEVLIVNPENRESMQATHRRVS